MADQASDLRTTIGPSLQDIQDGSERSEAGRMREDGKDEKLAAQRFHASSRIVPRGGLLGREYRHGSSIDASIAQVQGWNNSEKDSCIGSAQIPRRDLASFPCRHPFQNQDFVDHR
ncbi:MAG: hypothetical protein M1823_001960 [Watsoniomyces obsoletus]|nr:MAG: hypothetical protein M1823_001960 [Watsoniomyces obsoletus]